MELSCPKNNLIKFFNISCPKKVNKTPLRETGYLRNH